MTRRERILAAAAAVEAIAELVAAFVGAVYLADELGNGIVRKWWGERLRPLPEPVVEEPAVVGVARGAEQILREHNERTKGKG